jgi:hypothetical protein
MLTSLSGMYKSETKAKFFKSMKREKGKSKLSSIATLDLL